ncbi:sensor histidine kinase [Marinobacterium marinum]|uniref:histidine kinase n=1 Tax=Marinobacterium marinum TaxID=2756129 RepID=A0A7W2ACQ4_9GAMM|nr:ATP-binding protein [Marinobacterium marinum]MBA4502782.1 hypothetical protein [Marinobacterium marinum]
MKFLSRIGLACLWLLVAMVARGESSQDWPVIELSAVSSDHNLALAMQGMEPGASWVSVRQHPELLEAPRQASTLWLRARLSNSGAEPIECWLEFFPWSLQAIKVWQRDPLTGAQIEHHSVGLDTPVSVRDIARVRALVPVSIPVGQQVDFLVQIDSSSRPFLKLTSWEPEHFEQQELQRYRLHSVSLVVILTLFVLLLAQRDFKYLLVGIWMLALFVCESEKEGYITALVLGGATEYAAELRFISSAVIKALFIVLSVYILGLHTHRVWRWAPPAVLALTLLYSVLTFVLDTVISLSLLTGLSCLLLAVWPFMVPTALKYHQPRQKTLLALLGGVWVCLSAFFVMYFFAIRYTAEFDMLRIGVGAAIVLGLLLTYARHKNEHDFVLERQLHEREHQARLRLEAVAAGRTRALHEALVAAHKADEAKTAFLGRVTHDLKSPLSAIFGYARLLEGQSETVAHKGRIIDDSARHMLVVVDRLINYAQGIRDIECQPCPVHLPAFFASLEHVVSIQFSDKLLDFSVRLQPEAECTVMGDATLLREVLFNLLENACKYTEAGSVRLDVELRETSVRDGAILDMTVSDTGHGISLHEQSRVFEPFHRAASEHNIPGSGLGLAIVKELVHKMAGDISLYSKLDEGTRITVLLPVRILLGNG